MTSVTRSSKSARSTGVATRSRSAVIRRRRFGILGRAGGEELLERALARAALHELARELGALVEADLAAGDRRPEALLVLVQVLGVDALPLALDDGEAASDVGRDRDEPRNRRELAAGAALLPAARSRRDAGAFAVEVRVEQGVERDHPVVVGGRLGNEVDHDSGLLARVDAHDAADPLLVHAAGSRGREVHAHRGARRVPAFGEELRVDQDVDLAALVGGERLGESRGWRLPGDRLRLQPGGAELLREVVRVLDTGGVDDSGRGAEALAVEARRGLVQGLVVERGRQCPLLEVAADDRNRVDRGRGRHAHAAERSDEAAPGSVGEREIVHRGREDVRDLLGDELLGRRHADVERLVERADRGARLLSERRMGLVAEDEVVHGGVELAAVAREPGVGLDRDRVLPRRASSLEHRVREAVGIALGREIARELGDEQAAVREDEDAEATRRLDEAGSRDRLARCRGVSEPIAAHRTRVVALELRLELLLLDEPEVEVVLGVLVELDLGDDAVAASVPVAVLLGRALRGGDELGEHPGQSINLMAAELGSRRGARQILGQDPLQPEHEPVAHLPARRGLGQPGLHLLQRVVERGSAGGAGRERYGGILVRGQERLAEPRFGTAGRRAQILRCVRRQRRGSRRFVHMRSTYCWCRSFRELTPACLSGERYRQSIPQVPAMETVKRSWRARSARGRPITRCETPVWSRCLVMPPSQKG